MPHVNTFRLVLLAGALFTLSLLLNHRDESLDSDGRLGTPVNNIRNRRAPGPEDPGQRPSQCVHKGEVALTFDGGPNQHTRLVLDALSPVKAWSTFHVITRSLGNIAYVVQIKRMFDEGHVIGLRFPPNSNPLALNDDLLAKTLLSESQRIYEVIGRYPKFLRLPNEAVNERVMAVVDALGFRISSWNVDSLDTRAVELAAAKNVPVLEMFKAAFQRQLFDSSRNGDGGFIGLFHDQDSIYTDTSLLPDLVQFIVDSGYTVVTMDRCFGEQDAYRTENKDTRTDEAQPAAPIATKSSSTTVQFVFTTSTSAMLALVAVALFFTHM